MLLALALALVAAPSPTPLVEFHLEGEFIDPPDRLERVVKSELGPTYLPEPETPAADPTDCSADALAQAGTQTRLSCTLRQLGYDSAFAAVPKGPGVALTIVVHPQRRIRKVLVRPIFGIFPLFQEDILRRIRFRPGQALKPAAKLDKELEEERERVRQFLERQGYFDGQVEIAVKPTSRPEEVKLYVYLYKGAPYSLNDYQPLIFFEPDSDKMVLTIPEIRSFFHHHVWGRLSCLWLCGEFSLERLHDDMQTLLDRYHDLGFPGARVQNDFSPGRSLDRVRKEAHFTITVATRKKVEVAFRGNHHLGDDDLHKTLTFDQAGSFDSYEIQRSADAIHHAYQQDGYYEAEVTWQREDIARQNLVRITFFIHEGPELKVRGLEFVGNKSFGADALREVIDTKLFPAIGVIGLGEGGYLTNKQLAQDEDRLVAFYKKHGFPQASVTGEVAHDPSGFDAVGAVAAAVSTAAGRKDGDLYVRFTIAEGPLLSISGLDVIYKGEHRTARADALRHVRAAVGQPLTDEGVKNDVDTLRRWLRNGGFAQADVKAKTGDADGGKLLVFEITEGQVSHFGQTLLRGNFRTADSVITRELPWSPGDLYSETKVDEGERNLRLLGLFASIRLQFLPGDAEPGLLHTVVQVEERYDDWGSLEPAFGAASDSGAFVTLKYINRNLAGTGWGLELGGTYGQYRREAAGSLVFPRFLGSRFRVELAGFGRQEDTIRLGQINTFSGSVTLSREILPKLRLFWRYELKDITRPETLVRTSGPNEDTSTVQIPTLTGSLGTGLDYDRRDNPLIPTKGFRVSASGVFASRYLDPYLESATFVKLNLTATGYVPLGHGITVYAGLRVDDGIPLGGASLLPKVERFFAGGDTTVRGIEEDRLKTELVKFPVPPLPFPAYYGVQLIPVGGNVRILSKLELVMPLWRTYLQSALFLDTGLVTNSFDGLALADFRHSVGIAPFRLVSPVGFLSIEYAWPLDPQIGDDPTGRVHFNFGFGF